MPLFLFVLVWNIKVFFFLDCHIIMSCMVVQESRGVSRSDHAAGEVTGAPLKHV